MRARMLAARRALPPGAGAELAALACARIIALPEFEAATRVAAYHAVGAELDVALVAAAARAAAKPTLWPRVSRAGRLELVEASGGELEPDAAGVPAPLATRAAVRIAAGDVVLVPGLAFTRDGARLGRGGGHYDRLLAEAKGAAITVGVAFDIQLVRELPLEPHDEGVDVVVTPNGTWRTT
jgi:5-formyltetrahydrofolate cyclo-ligase